MATQTEVTGGTEVVEVGGPTDMDMVAPLVVGERHRKSSKSHHQVSCAL